MAQAVILSGFVAGSTSVAVAVEVANGTTILLYDDNELVLLGSGTVTGGSTTITLTNPLFAGQRIIAYITTFGAGAYKGVTVLDSDIEKTGWKTPETVDGDTYADYLTGGGSQLPEIYDPENCRNFARDYGLHSALIEQAITFTLRQIETQAGTVQVTIEDIANALGGVLIKFDSDTAGTTASKTYNANGTYQVKVWGANQTEADAIVKTYTLTMPAAVTTFGVDIFDLQYRMDLGNTSTPGQRPIDVIAFSDVAVEIQIDGVTTWATALNQSSSGSFRESKITQFVAVGMYTIRARRQSDGLDVISREINIVF